MKVMTPEETAEGIYNWNELIPKLKNSSETGDYTERFKPIIQKYRLGIYLVPTLKYKT